MPTSRRTPPRDRCYRVSPLAGAQCAGVRSLWALALDSLTLGAFCFSLLARPAAGQIVDDFDEEIRTNARWIGDRSRWRTVREDGNGLLAPDPVGASDTLALTAVSRTDPGRWLLTLSYRTNLTHRYAVRWYLTANSPDLRGPARGYFLRVGGNALDRIALYRQDGPDGRATLVGASEGGITGGSEGRIRLAAERSAHGRWTVEAEDEVLFSAADTTYRGSQYTGLWVHFRGEERPALLFDELRVRGTVDRRAPDLKSARFDPASGRVHLRFDEPIDPGRVDRAAFRIEPVPGLPARVEAPPPPVRRVELLTARPLRPGTHRVRAPGVTDVSGNPVPLDRALSFRVEGDTAGPRVRLLEVLPSDPAPGRVRLRLHPSEPIDPATLGALTVACRPSARLEEAVLGAEPVAPVPTPLVLTLRTLRAETEPRTCRLGGLADGTGNRMQPTDHPVVHPPRRGDLVLTELLIRTAPAEVTAPLPATSAAAPTAAPEYVELLNRSGRTLSLYGVSGEIAPPGTPPSGRPVLSPRPPSVLESGSYWVIASDPDPGADPPATSRLARAFPGAELRPPDVLLSTLDRTRLGLRDGGAEVRIRSEDGTVLETLTYGPDWHHPALADSRGVALERIDPAAPANDRSNWSSSPRGGTPGAPGALQSHSGPEDPQSTLRLGPSPFSPDGDGVDDVLRIDGRFATPVVSVRIRIFDTTGRRVRELVPADLPGPEAQWTWDGRDDGGRALPVGPYVVVLDELDLDTGTSRRHRAVAVLARRR